MLTRVSLRRARRLWITAVSTLAVALVASGVVASASAAEAAGTGSFLLADDFTHHSVASPDYTVGGQQTVGGSSVPNTPCLTASGPATSNAPAPCAASGGDAEGSGALRLTGTTNETTGFLLYNRALPTQGGLDISFNVFEYGGSGADGIVFFLTDGSKPLTRVGAAGGSLGYQNTKRTDLAQTEGIPDSLLGIAFDAYGNFAVETPNTPATNGGSCATSGGTSLNADTVAVRGPGRLSSGRWSDGYCLLDSPRAVGGTMDGASRDAAKRMARIVIDPPTAANPHVRVYLGAANGGPLPATPQVDFAQTVAVWNGGPTLASYLSGIPTFKFGWAAGTGGQTNTHEINTLQVESVVPIAPTATMTATAASSPADVGEAASVSFAPTLSTADGPLAPGETVTLTVSHSADTELGSPAAGPWTRTSTSSTRSVYSYTAPAGTGIAPGTALPTLTVPVRSDLAGSVSISGTLTNDSGSIDVTQAATVAFRPTVSDLSGQGIADAAAPDPVTIAIDPPAAGGAPVSYHLGDMGATPGSESFGFNGAELSFTPRPGYAGRRTFSYYASVGGQDSLPGTVTVDIAPVVTDHSATTPYLTDVTVPLALGSVGAGSYRLTGPTLPATAGSASVSGSGLTVTPANGFSGDIELSYYGVSADGQVESAPRTVTVTVEPRVADGSVELALDADGDGSDETDLPVPEGSAPFSFEKLSDPDSGALAIGEDGHVTYTAESGVAGVFTARYRVTDAGGTPSPGQTLTITVRPHTSALSGSGLANGGTVVLPAPTTVGGAAAYALATDPDPALGTAEIDAETGVIAFSPAAGASGVATFGYTATVDGAVSQVATVTVAIAPTLAPITRTTENATPIALDLTAGAVGSDLFYQVADGGPEHGELSGSVVSGAFSYTPEAGFSGVDAFSVRAVDGDGTASAAAQVRITVLPAALPSAPDVSLPTDAGEDLVFTLPAPDGTGPFTYELVPGGFPEEAGELTIDPETGEVTFSPAPGVSGVIEAEYRVVDDAGNASPAQTITLTVRPSAPAGGAEADRGDGGITVPAPVVNGTGPFSFALDELPDPDVATVEIDPGTGEIVVTPTDPGWSGEITLSYVATDASEVDSAPVRVTVLVRPTVGPVTGHARQSGAPIGTTLSPGPTGSGPFEYRIVEQPEHGAATATAGGVVLTPDPDYAGALVARFVVVDAHGVESTPQLATLVVDALAETGSSPTILATTVATLIALGLALGAIALTRRRRGAHRAGA